MGIEGIKETREFEGMIGMAIPSSVYWSKPPKA
jgi:hypothetical protein